MLTLNDGRDELWQWDTGRTLSVDADCSQVHFSNKVFGRSIDVDVVAGAADIPDILLQTDKDLNVWAFVGTAENGYTKISKIFTVNRRNKPADYVFTPTDQMTLHTIQSQIGDLAGLTTEAKENLVAAINEAARSGGGGGGSTVELDTTLTQSGKAADAKAVGDALAGKQDTISDLEAIRSGAANGATALQAVPSTYRTATAQDAIDNGLSDRVSAIEGKEAGWDAKSNFSGNYNDLTNKPTIPTALPNPNALTFTGAVTGSYDGSAPLSVEIPSGGWSGSDISLGLTGAAVGQIAKIIAVDDTGKPTAWESVDMPTGGSESTFEKVVEMTTAEDAAVISISTGKNGNPLSMSEFYVAITTARNSAATKNNCFYCNVLPDTVPFHIRNKSAIKNIMLFQDVYCYVMHYKLMGGMIFHEYVGRARTRSDLNVAAYLENEKEIGVVAESESKGTIGFLSPLYAVDGSSKIDSAGKMYCITFSADSAECIFGAGTRVEVWAR